METHKAPSSADEFELAGHALAHGPIKGVSGKGPGPAHKQKVMKEMHVKEMHGGYHVTLHHGGVEPPTEHMAHDLDTVHDHMEEHLGSPNDGEAEADSGTGEHAGGDAGTAESHPGGGQGQSESHMEA